MGTKSNLYQGKAKNDRGAHVRGKPAIEGNKADTNKQIKATGLAVTSKLDGLTADFNKLLPIAKTRVADGLQAYTACVALDGLTDVQLRDLHDYGAELSTAVTDATSLARARVLDMILRNGEPKGDKGTVAVKFADGTVKEARAQKSGLDPSKVEAAIRARQLDVRKYMQEQVKYAVTDDTAKKLVDDKVFTPDELEGMKHQVTYAVQRTKQQKDGES